MKRSNKFSVFGMMLTFLLILLSTAKITLADNSPTKIPITTSSAKAKDDFLKGRDLSEKLRVVDSRAYFQKAVQEDPNFATAYLNLALAQLNAKGFFEDLTKAVALSKKVSEGERLVILGTEAGANGLPAKQGEYYGKLVADYPGDERAHNLLGTYYFGLQQYDKAAQEYEKAIQINPQFSPAYNLLGYVYRFLGNYNESEKAFKKYIELIPDDPNPYDSYAELLLKIGRFDESIQNYRNALSKDQHFFNSYLGMATDYNLKREHQTARVELQKLYDTARVDGERRAALFAMTVSYVDEGNWQKGLEQQERMFALAQKINDPAGMAGDLDTMGTILLEYGRVPEAKAKFDQEAKTMSESNLSQDVKEAARRNDLFNSAQVAVGQKDFKQAHVKAEEYRKAAEAAKNQFEIWQAHEIAGRIALEEKNYDLAVAELKQSNLQNPYNIYRLSIAYQGQGDNLKSKEFLDQAIKFNALNSLPYSFVRAKNNSKV